jgi:hypothetical protein
MLTRLVVFGMMVMIMASTVSILPVNAAGGIKTDLALGVKKSDDPNKNTVSGDPDFALPKLVQVGDVQLVYGRLAKIDGKAFGGLANKEVKLVDIYNDAQNPILLATATTDEEGYFVFEWNVQAKVFQQFGVYKLQEGIGAADTIRLQVIAKFDGDDTYATSTSRGYVVDLKPLRLITSIMTDKQLYNVDEIASVTITFKDFKGNPIDPDSLEVIYDSLLMSPLRKDVGSYFFTTPTLTERLHMVTVIAEKEEFVKETRTATITSSAKIDVPVAILAVLDQPDYGVGDYVELSGKVRPAFVERAVLVDVRNPNGVIYTVAQVFPNEDGTFKHEFRLGGSLALPGTWKFTTTYLGQQTSSEFEVGMLQTKFSRVTVELPETITDDGDPVSQGDVGRPLGIQANLANNEKRDISLTYIVKVTDSDGFTVMVSWIKGAVLKSGLSAKPAIFWIPEASGNYTIDIFVWDSLENPIPLSAPAKIKLGVT